MSMIIYMTYSLRIKILHSCEQGGSIDFRKNGTKFHFIIIQLDSKGITIREVLRPEILSAFRFYRHL